MLVLHYLAVVQAQVSVEARESYFQLLFPFCFLFVCFLFVCLFIFVVAGFLVVVSNWKGSLGH